MSPLKRLMHRYPLITGNERAEDPIAFQTVEQELKEKVFPNALIVQHNTQGGRSRYISTHPSWNRKLWRYINDLSLRELDALYRDHNIIIEVTVDPYGDFYTQDVRVLTWDDISIVNEKATGREPMISRKANGR